MTYPFFLFKLLAQSGVARLVPAVRRLFGGGTSFLHYYSDRALAAPWTDLQAAGHGLEAGGRDVIDLALGAPRFDLMPSMGTKLPADRRGSPPTWGLSELRGAVASRQPKGAAGEVLITAGVAGAFNLVLDAFVNPGARVVLFDPSAPMYHRALQQRRARIRWLPTWAENGRTRFDPAALRHRLRGARLIVLNSPANPSGCILHPEDLEQIAWCAERHDVLIFNDEAYDRYRYEGERGSIASQARARRLTLTAGSVSKGHALSAARVGWLTGHRHLVRACAVTAAAEAALVPTLCQQLALTALEQPEEAFAAIRTEYDARRHYLCERLTALGLQPVWPAGAFFLWLPVAQLGMTGSVFADRLLREQKVVVSPGEHFGPNGASFVRISYVEEDGRLREGFKRIKEFVQGLGPVGQTPKKGPSLLRSIAGRLRPLAHK